MSFEDSRDTPPVPFMTETDPEIIDAQIAAKLEEGTAFQLVNNFPSNLPGGHYRTVVENQNLQDTMFLDPGTNPRQHNSRGLQATWRSFFADVDAAMMEAGTTAEELHRLKSEKEKLGTPSSRELFYRYTIPVYRELRIVGYSHTDLIR